MRITEHKKYAKHWKKLSPAEKGRVLATLKLFMAEPANPKLRFHQLKGVYYPQYSISAGGDLRIHLQQVEPDRFMLLQVGTHSQLYG